mgnify:CR=1 FL=1
MRSLVALAVLAVADAGKKAKGEYSWDQAKCLFKKRKIVFLGDSNTRYFSFQFATFLEKGEYRSDDYDKWGEPGDDYPGDRVVEVTSRDFCSDSVAAWLGYPLEYDFGFTWFKEAEWQVGNRRSVCWARTSS